MAMQPRVEFLHEFTGLQQLLELNEGWDVELRDKDQDLGNNPKNPRLVESLLIQSRYVVLHVHILSSFFKRKKETNI